MKNNKTITKYITVIIMFLSCINSFAQNPIDPGSGGDPGAVPIGDWVIPMMLLGLFLMFVYFRKQQKQQIN